MLKLTNSFYRCLITCDRVVYKLHVKKLSHTFVREKCRAGSVDLESKAQSQARHNLKQNLKTKNTEREKLQIKIPPLNSDEFEKSEQMSESVQPTGGHVSTEQFSICSDDTNKTENFCKTRSSSSNNNYTKIPSDFRHWESVVSDKGPGNGSKAFKFSVVSYNVLAQYLLECHPYLYTECARRDLKWRVRSARLYDEIIAMTPDILCLQEVQESHLDSFYSRFENIGYCGVYKKKTGRRHDGCAIYYNDSLFQLKDYVHVEFYQPDMPLLNRDNIGMIVKLAPRCAPHSPVVVATTHLLYNPGRTDVRLAQMQVFLAEIDRFAYFNHGTECGHLPIILTGDFNSLPESPVIQLLDLGHVSSISISDESDWRRIGVTDNCQHLAVSVDRSQGKHTAFTNLKIFNSKYSKRGSSETERTECDQNHLNDLFNTGRVCQSLALTSVYDKEKQDGRPEATTFQDCWVTVDYIYFSRYSSLRLTERLRLPAADECPVLSSLPNSVYASDHLALAAVFEIAIPASVQQRRQPPLD